jgi:hypothetical protein
MSVLKQIVLRMTLPRPAHFPPHFPIALADCGRGPQAAASRLSRPAPAAAAPVPLLPDDLQARLTSAIAAAEPLSLMASLASAPSGILLSARGSIGAPA